MAINLSRSKHILVARIQDYVKDAYQEMGLHSNDLISFFNLVEIMNKLGYINNCNDQEKFLLN